jgi:hypothetical protein
MAHRSALDGTFGVLGRVETVSANISIPFHTIDRPSGDSQYLARRGGATVAHGRPVARASIDHNHPEAGAPVAHASTAMPRGGGLTSDDR